MARHFVRVDNVDLPPNERSIGVIVNGWPVLVARSNGELYAVIDRCSHAASDFRSGRVRRGALQCPLHGARFELATGKCFGNTYSPILTFAIREVAGAFEVEVPEEAPGRDHMPVTT